MSNHLAKRYAAGIVVYNTNNYTKGIVLDGTTGKDDDPSSWILELGHAGLFTNTPPNRALIPTGEYFDIKELISLLTVAKDGDGA